MKKKSSSGVLRHDPRDEIISRARKGAFDCNPLLATPHELVCKACGCKLKTTYLDHLKSGRFEFGETRVIEVSYAAPTISGLDHAVERITPVVMKVKCERCGTEISCSPISLEYLLFATTKQEKMRSMYV
jgi:hypothetical protein